MQELGVLVASLYSKKQNASKWILGWTWPTFGDFKAGTIAFPSFIEDLSIKEHLLEAMTRITRYVWIHSSNPRSPNLSHSKQTIKLGPILRN